MPSPKPHTGPQSAATILDLGYVFSKLPLGKPRLLPQILQPESSGEAQLTHLGSAGLLKVRVHLVSYSGGGYHCHLCPTSVLQPPENDLRYSNVDISSAAIQ